MFPYAYLSREMAAWARVADLMAQAQRDTRRSVEEFTAAFMAGER